MKYARTWATPDEGTSDMSHERTSQTGDAAAPASVLTDEEKAWVQSTSEIMARTQSLLVVSIMVMHENSTPSQEQTLAPPGGGSSAVRTQGLIDSCAFVSCVTSAILKYVQEKWSIELRPRIVFGYMNFLQPKHSGEDAADVYVSVPHLWVETTHDRVAELCKKATGSDDIAERERVRITDIAGGITHNREKRLLGRPFHAHMVEDNERSDRPSAVTATYTKTPKGRIPPGLETNVQQMAETAASPLDTLRKYAGTRGMLIYKSIVKKLKAQAEKKDVGKYNFNMASLDNVVTPST